MRKPHRTGAHRHGQPTVVSQVSLRPLLQFDEHAVGGGRMHERHQRAFRAGPRLFVDEPRAARFELRERRADVLDPQRDVMQAGAPLLEIPGDRRIRSGCFEELELGFANRHEVRPDALRHDLFRRLDLEAQRVAIERERRRQILHRNPDVIEYRLRELVSQRFMDHLERQVLAAGELGATVDRIAARELDPYTAANDLLRRALK